MRRLFEKFFVFLLPCYFSITSLAMHQDPGNKEEESSNSKSSYYIPILHELLTIGLEENKLKLKILLNEAEDMLNKKEVPEKWVIVFDADDTMLHSTDRDRISYIMGIDIKEEFELEPNEQVLEFYQKMVLKKGFRAVVITARDGADLEVKEGTANNLKKAGYTNIEEIIYTKNKQEAYKKLIENGHQIACFLDDLAENLVGISCHTVKIPRLSEFMEKYFKKKE